MAGKHSIEWHAASPLWDRTLDNFGVAPERFKAPVLLRFAGDTFIEDLQEQLAMNPQDLADYVASAESWRAEAVGWATAHSGNGGEPIKLYQPVHNRFYLVAASLICRTPGLPERTVNAREAETASFVIRRLAAKPNVTLDPNRDSTFDEYGWFGNRQSGTWELIPDRGQVMAGEERLPLFPVGFQMEQRQRRLHAGLIPVGSREIYDEGARQSVARTAAADVVGDSLAHPKVAEFLNGVINGLTGLTQFPEPPGSLSGVDLTEAENQLDRQAREILIVVLLDLVEFLEAELKPVFEALKGGPGGLPDPSPKRTLYDYLFGITLIGSLRATEALKRIIGNATTIGEGPIDDTLATALFGTIPDRVQVRDMASRLLGGSLLEERVTDALGDARTSEFRNLVKAWSERIDAWTDETDDAEAREDLLMILLDLTEFLERELAGVWQALAAGSSSGLTGADRDLYIVFDTPLGGGLSWRQALVDAEQHRAEILIGALNGRLAVIRQGVGKAAIEASAAGLFAGTLTATVSAALNAHPLATQPPTSDTEPTDAVYVVRCVYERPRCRGFKPPVVSLPSRPFRLASFFDSDAPVRHIQIRMPTDTSVRGLRRFPKNVSIALSKQLREQMARAQNAGLEGLTNQEVGAASFNLGVICTFSIPIITICALILLMIIVQLLNIVFWWLPFFKICLPVGSRQ